MHHGRVRTLASARLNSGSMGPRDQVKCIMVNGARIVTGAEFLNGIYTARGKCAKARLLEWTGAELKVIQELFHIARGAALAPRRFGRFRDQESPLRVDQVRIMIQ